ncbi:21934_t:CDS:2, partial [Racocetra persica]
EDLINLPEELEPLETLYISNKDSSFSEGSTTYQLPISTFPPESVILNPNFSISCESFGFETDPILDQIDIEANPTDILLYTVNSTEEEIVQTEIEILEEDPDQNLRIIEEIHLGVKKGIEKILEIIIDMIEADLEIIIDMIEAGLKEYIIYWDSYRIIVPTTYKHNQAIEEQPIVSKVDNDWEEEYEDEELISHEAYILEAESNNIKDSG